MRKANRSIKMAAVLFIACLPVGCNKANPVASGSAPAIEQDVTVTDASGTAEKNIGAYLAYDNTVTTTAAANVVRQARDYIKAQFTAATWTFTYSTSAKWSSPANATSSGTMLGDLQTDFPGYPNGSYHTCIGISRRPTAANDNPGLEGKDRCFIDYRPDYSTYNSYIVTLVMHEWGHSLGASQCSSSSCVMSAYGWSHGKTAFCSACRSKIKTHLGI